MKRERQWRRVLLLILLPLWLTVFGLSVKLAIEGRNGVLPTRLSLPSADAYPVVYEVPPRLQQGAENVQAGDVLIRAGAVDLRGMPIWRVHATAHEALEGAGAIAVTVERDGQRLDRAVPALREPFPWTGVVVSLSFALMGLLILMRAPEFRLAATVCLGLLAYALYWTPFRGGEHVVLNAASLFLNLLLGFLIWPLLVLSLLAMVRSPGQRLPRWPWVFALLGVLRAEMLLGSTVSFATVVRTIWCLEAFFIGSLLFVLIRGYRRADALGRRKLKWLVYGIVVGIVPILVADVVSLAFPSLAALRHVSLMASALPPVAMYVATTRFQLLDIDRLISATATYTALGVVFLAVLMALVPKLSHAAAAATGMSASGAQSLLSLVLAALIVPGQRILRPWLDRLFQRERAALGRGVEALLSELSACASPQEMLTLAGDRLMALLRTESCAIFARVGTGYPAVYSKGAGVTPVFDEHSRLPTRLGHRAFAITASELRDRRLSDPPSEMDLAALASLAAEVVLPIQRRGELAAWIVLGPKRSADIYLDADLALLTAVGSQLSAGLERFDSEDLRAQAFAMQDALRRYVPGAVVRQIESGGDMEAQAREVTILFVDIRGYTGYSASRSASEIFAMINRYTERVSRIVIAHGGALVEFHGDGLMAIFGAPQDLPHKEQAAVRAAAEVVQTVQGAPMDASGATMEVGIGIATGEAFVGNIQAVDRAIWGAIGNTTNLASRLQNLTKELGGPIVVDEATWRAAAEAAANFRCHRNIAIRGRPDAQDVYVSNPG